MIRLLLFTFLLIAALLLATANFFVWGGVSANLLLLTWLLILFGRFEKSVGSWEILILAVIFLAICFFYFGFWLKPAFALVLVAGLISVLRRFLTGNELADFLIGNAVAIFSFYGLLAAVEWSGFSFVTVGWEALYNLVLGILIWFLFDFLFFQHDQASS
ncbi:MAG: hypothetical protein UY51_C0005G0078 [Candidatus Jorgensenbacteria bacterium GW2011_GWB1_49_9]|nr:MAG: hypothetical protein UY51_C0005G0078 [Candidatus Jorgensenbacteria bacterium GW2011_GWB1_49_9]